MVISESEASNVSLGESKPIPSSDIKPGDSSPEKRSDVSDRSETPLIFRRDRSELDRLNKLPLQSSSFNVDERIFDVSRRSLGLFNLILRRLKLSRPLPVERRRRFENPTCEARRRSCRSSNHM